MFKRNTNKYNKNNNNKEIERKSQFEDVKHKHPQRKTQVVTTLRDALTKYAIPCAKGGDLQAYLNREGIPCYPAEGWVDGSVDHHIVTHAARDYAQIMCFRDAAGYLPAFGGGETLKVLDVFGRQKHWKLPRAVEGVGVEVYPIRPELYAGDLGRAFLADAGTPLTAHVSMMVDIYQHGRPEDALTPLAVAKACSESRAKVCYVIMHDLSELYGCHVFRGTVGTGEDRRQVVSVEGSWTSVVKDQKRYISFQPDRRTVPYPLHPYPAWLETGAHEFRQDGRSVAWLHMHQLGTCGPYMIWKCRLGDTKPEPVLPTQRPEARFADVSSRLDMIGGLAQAVIAKSKKLFAYCGGYTRDLMSKDQCDVDRESGYLMYQGVAPIDMGVARKVQHTSFLKDINGRVIQTAMAAATDAFADSPFFPVSKRYPSLTNTILLNSVIWGLTMRVDETLIERIEEIPALDRERVRAVNMAKPVPGRASWWGYLKHAFAVAGLFGAAWYALRRKWLRVGLGMAVDFEGNVVELKDAIGALFNPVPLVSVVCEEILKCTAPAIGVGLSLFEAVKALSVATSVQQGIGFMLLRIPATAMHLGTAAMYQHLGWRALPLGLLLHMLFNVVITATVHVGLSKITEDPPTSGLDGWAAAWEAGEDSHMRAVIPLDEDTRLRAFPARTDLEDAMQDWRKDFLVIKLNGVKLTLEQAKLLQEEPCKCHHVFSHQRSGDCGSCNRASGVKFSYPLAITSGHLWQPSAGMFGTLACTALRDFVDNFGIYASVTTETEAMAKATSRLRKVYPIMCDILADAQQTDWFTQEECAVLLGGGKGQLYRKADEDVNQHGRVGKTKLQIKYNETIKCRPAGPTELCAHVKPRSVKNVSTQDQTAILPFSRAFDKDFKAHLDGTTVYAINGFNVRFVICHATEDHMARISELLHVCEDIVIVVSCDDMIMSTGRYAGYFGFAYAELDFEAFDQSQHAAFWNFDREVLRTKCNWSGFDEFWDHHFLINNMPVKATVTDRVPLKEFLPETLNSQDTLEIKAILRTQMRTGVATTSLMGSFHSVIAYVYWLLRCREDRPADMVESMAALYLKAKLKVGHVLLDHTFLRGFFWTKDGKHGWSVLPSAVLKIGKLMRDPRELFGKVRKQAIANALAAICASVNVPDDFPILAEFKRLADRVRAAHGEAPMRLKQHLSAFVEDMQYKMRSSSCPRDVALEFMLRRYDLTEADVVDCEAIIASVKDVPVLICHNVFERMRAVDYN